ncbi:MAG: Fic family protein [Okeania sp. SIO3C4]|nr:Fic family protein [Okeania sp. SIO3C4]
MDVVNSQGSRAQTRLLKGEWKQLPNNPRREDGSMHYYCPPEHVSQEMDNLISMHATHMESEFPPEIESAWLHHRFTQIHPFQDGNGRVARALASIIFMRAGLFPLVITRNDREAYIEKLELADAGNLAPLAEFFVKKQKTELIRALSITGDLLEKTTPINDILESAKVKLQKRLRDEVKYDHAFKISQSLEDMAFRKLEPLKKELQSYFDSLTNGYNCLLEKNEEYQSHWFKSQIISIAKVHDYFADTRSYAKWVRFKIKEDRQVDIVFSFHALGTTFLGIMAVSAFIEYRDRDGLNQTIIEGPYNISDEPFQFAYNEDENLVEQRFSKWLDSAVLVGLEKWRRQL